MSCAIELNFEITGLIIGTYATLSLRSPPTDYNSIGQKTAVRVQPDRLWTDVTAAGQLSMIFP